MTAVQLYFRYIGISIRSQMQYRASFVFMTIGHFLNTGVEVIGIWALFDRFKSLGSWNLPDIALLYGMISLAFALAESTARGFDSFSFKVRTGDFDRLLLRPRSTAFQVAAQELQLMRAGRFIQGLIVLLWAAFVLNVTWNPARISLTLFAILGGACLFYGLFIIQATLSFWTVETLELMNTVTYGGTEAGQYPLPIYRPWFRKFFTVVVPLACVTYFPSLAILDRSDTLLHSPVWFHYAAPAIGILFMITALRIWRFGVLHYHSTGS